MCNRRYNESAFTKHLPTCERRSKEAAAKSKNGISTGSILNTTSGSNKPGFNMKFKK